MNERRIFLLSEYFLVGDNESARRITRIRFTNELIESDMENAIHDVIAIGRACNILLLAFMIASCDALIATIK